MNGLSPAPQLAVARNVVTSATNPATPATHQRPMRMPTTAAAAATSTVVIAGKLTGCKFGAGDGNRTHVTSLEGWRTTIVLRPLFVEGGSPYGILGNASYWT